MNTMNSIREHYKTSLFMAFLFLFVIVLAGCATNGGGTGNGGTPTPMATTVVGLASSNGATPTATLSPGVKPGAQSCPSAVKAPAHWDGIIATSNGDRVESVSCGNLIGNSSLQAVIGVRSHSIGGFLTVYVYNNITAKKPAQLFKLEHLNQGNVKISGYSTLLTVEIDTGSSINKGQPDGNLKPDLYREFKWSDGAGAFEQTAFPGIYPDLTRFQAEIDQAQVNHGHDPWKLDARMTAQAFATFLLKWPIQSQAILVSGGGLHDNSAVVNVTNTNNGISNTVTVTLSRLEGNTNGGIWEIVAVTSKGMSITSPQNRARITDFVTVTGTGNAFEGVIGKLFVLDHLYTDIGHAQAKGAQGMGKTTFSTNVTVTPSFHGGSQEAVLVLYSYSQANGSITGAVMLKQLVRG